MLTISKRHSISHTHLRNGLLFALPWIVGFLAFQLYPIGASLYYSFTQYDIFSPPRWIGLQNYAAVFQDSNFYQALGNTVYMIIIGLPIGLIGGFLIGHLMNGKTRLMPLFRTSFFLPNAMPAVASLFVMLWLFNPAVGLVNQILGLVHLPQPLWYDSATWAKPFLIGAGLWGVGYTGLLYLSAMKAVPSELYEAAQLDGAGTWAQMRHITIPMVSPVTLFLLITGMIGTLSSFTSPYIIGGGSGSPDGSLLFLSVYIYSQALHYLNMGYASALAWTLLVMSLLLTLTVLKWARGWLFYGGQ